MEYNIKNFDTMHTKPENIKRVNKISEGKQTHHFLYIYEIQDCVIVTLSFKSSVVIPQTNIDNCIYVKGRMITYYNIYISIIELCY